jgi:hypothetical protein
MTANAGHLDEVAAGHLANLCARWHKELGGQIEPDWLPEDLTTDGVRVLTRYGWQACIEALLGYYSEKRSMGAAAHLREDVLPYLRFDRRTALEKKWREYVGVGKRELQRQGVRLVQHPESETQAMSLDDLQLKDSKPQYLPPQKHIRIDLLPGAFQAGTSRSTKRNPTRNRVDLWFPSLTAAAQWIAQAVGRTKIDPKTAQKWLIEVDAYEPERERGKGFRKRLRRAPIEAKKTELKSRHGGSSD